ncbi:flavin-dependent oxidoreductase [Streptomyces sp. NPDC005438]|uniref:flavin-dependent oxidoreductase n=1 Tax=Streptomyces sp. NPDC005438 TaxID=3156880 RepID=UPI0033BC8486
MGSEQVGTLIVGAGIAGLSAALSLHAAGMGEGVRVVDGSRRLLPLGAGINLQPHAVRELTELGLGERLAAVSAEPRRLRLTDRHGNPVAEHPRGRDAGYRWPQLSVHRGALQELLLEAVRERLGPGAIRTGLALESYRHLDDGVAVTLRDRANSDAPEELRASVLLGADGLHSAVRRQLHPGEGAPRWNGIRMWRGVTRAPAPLDGHTMVIAGSYRPARAVVYPVGDGQVNWVAEVRVSEPGPLSDADWSRAGRLSDVLPHYEDWRIQGLDIGRLLRDAPGILEYPMVDRDPLDSWGEHRVTLLGDAAHPMLPVGSNGGSQAILDARVLTWHLAHHRDHPEEGLRAYEHARLKPVNAIAAACRDMPVDRLLDTVADRAPDGFARIEDVLTADELTGLRGAMRRTTDMDVETLNSGPSWSV